MATVFAARDEAKGRDVALKVLNSDQVRIERRRARFMREFAILSKLHHPAIVSVFEQHEVGEIPFFSMELLSGKTLAQQITEMHAADAPADLLSTDRLVQL